MSQKVAVSSRDDGSVLSVLRSVFISTVGEGIRIPPPDKWYGSGPDLWNRNEKVINVKKKYFI